MKVSKNHGCIKKTWIVDWKTESSYADDTQLFYFTGCLYSLHCSHYQLCLDERETTTTLEDLVFPVKPSTQHQLYVFSDCFHKVCWKLRVITDDQLSFLTITPPSLRQQICFPLPLWIFRSLCRHLTYLFSMTLPYWQCSNHTPLHLCD